MASYRNFGSNRNSSRNIGVFSNSSTISSITSLYSSLDGSISELYAEVLDIVYNRDSKYYVTDLDIGKIRIRYFGESATTINSENNTESPIFAYPIYSYFNSYPVIGETVHILVFNGINYYSTVMNTTHHVNNNSLPNASAVPSVESKSDTTSLYTSNSSANTNTKKSNSNVPIKIGKTFKSRNYIPSLYPNEGDFIISGRFGNYIRIGNNPTTNSPNIKLTLLHNVDSSLSNRYISEDKYILSNSNKYNSYIWLLSDEIVNINSATSGKSIFLKSFNKNISNYNRSQIILNSERIIINSSLSELYLFSGGGISLNTNQSIAIDASKPINLYSDTGIKLSSNNVNVIGNKITLGDGDNLHPIVLGDELITLLGKLIDEITQITVANGSGVTGFPLNSVKLSSIKLEFNKILSKIVKTK